VTDPTALSGEGKPLTLGIVVMCLLFAVSIAIGQLLFKVAANSIRRPGSSFFVNAITSPSVWVAFAWYGSTSFLWLYVLMRVPLNRAYPFALLGSALVPAFAWAAFGERVAPSYFVGGAVVLVGLYIIFGNAVSQ
jgi:drug/metabolite transporter (DMT)-like permease